MNFLNGTTDSKDECSAMYKAWEIADCKDYSQLQLQLSVSVSNSTKNKTDDLLIDDAFEKWECCSR
jgi:hypothetical protein